MSEVKLYNGDCLDVMKDIPDKSVDMVLCDLPYGVLNKSNRSAKWDNVIPFEPLWKQYERIIKDNGAILLFCQGMFTAKLMASNEKLWRYNLVWDKCGVTGFLNANRMPLRCHEDIAVFYKSLPIYNPQMEEGMPNHPRGSGVGKDKKTNSCYGKHKETEIDYGVENGIDKNASVNPNEKFPRSIIRIKKEHEAKVYHPTQKSVDLLEYLIRTYSNEGDTVLDNTMGSGSTGVACVNTNRNFIGIELDENYFKIAEQRINEANNCKLF